MSRRYCVRRYLDPYGPNPLSMINTERSAYALLAGGIKQDTSGKWVSTDFSAEDDTLGAPGGKLRIFAAAVLMREHPGNLLITGGGKGHDMPASTIDERPLLADILSQELLECGVPKGRILLERRSNTTFQELQELERMVPAHGFTHLSVITSRWHIPRCRAMVDAKFSHLKELAHIEYIAAEDVLIAYDPARWQKEIADGYAADFMIERILKEEHGVAQIRAGTYNFK